MPGRDPWRWLRRLSRTSPLLASLQVRLVLLVLMAILPALGLIIINALQFRRAGTTAARESASRVVRSAASQHEHLLESTRQLLLTLSQLRQVQLGDAEACQATFDHLRALHPVYSEMGVFDLQGNPIAISTENTNRAGFTRRPFVQRALAQDGFLVDEYYINTETKLANLPMAAPVYNRDKPEAVVMATLDLSWLIKMIGQLDLPHNSSFTLFDRNRLTLLRHPDPQFVGERLPSSRTTEPPQAMNMAEGVRVITSRDGTRRLYAFAVLGAETQSPALISVGIPLEAAYAPANRMLVRNLIFLGVVGAFALSAAWIGGQVLVLRRVRALLRATDRLAQGDLKARTNLSPSRGELGQLEEAFDSMAAALEARVTERQQAEAQLTVLNEQLEARVAARTLELKRSNEDLDQFASVASHDLQEPLRMVTSYLQLLEQRYASGLDSKAREFINFATDGAARMQQLIRDLLTYSRVSTQEHPFQQVDCEEILDTALSNLQIAIQESGATLTHDSLPTLPGNPTLLTQLFQNLIANAVKFRTEQPPHIHVGAAPENQHWHFTVRDDGIGISPEDFQRVFAIFQRLHARDAYPGTGIGLAVCKKIVERHQGRIWVEPTPGQGTTFHFTLAGRA